MKYLFLITLISCGSLGNKGLERFGEVKEFEAKLVNQDLNGRLVETERYIPYVVSEKSCFPEGYSTESDIITVARDDHEILLYEMSKQTQNWRYSEVDNRQKVYGVSDTDQTVITARCTIQYFFNIIFAFDHGYVSFLRTKK